MVLLIPAFALECAASGCKWRNRTTGVSSRYSPDDSAGPHVRQPVEMLADVRGFGGSISERDGAVESDARFFVPPELQQERAARAEVVKIVREPSAPAARSSASAASGPTHLGGRDRAVERDHGRRLHEFERCVERIDLRPVGLFSAWPHGHGSAAIAACI